MEEEEGVTYKLISLFIVREERSLLLLLVLDKGLERKTMGPWEHVSDINT